MWAGFADTVAAWGTMRLLDPGASFTTVELKMNVFAAGVDGRRARSASREPLHVGRRTQVWEVRVRRERDDRLMANFVCTQMILGD